MEREATIPLFMSRGLFNALPIRYKLALARYRDGAVEAALADARRAIALDGQLADPYYLAALCLHDGGQAAEAVAAFKQAIERSPALLAAREELADMFAADGRATEQIEQLQALAALDGNRAERQIAIGLAQAHAGNTDLAVATLSAALDRAPDQSPVNAALGRIWLQLAEDGHERAALGKALEALERAASALSATSETKALYGRALALAGQLDAAEQVFEQAAERYPVDPSALRQLSTVAEQLGHTNAARSALIEYVSLRPTDRDTAGNAARIGTLSLALHDAPGALPWLQRALAEHPQNIGVLSAMADAQLQTGDAAAARLTLNRAIALDSSNSQVLALDRRIRKSGP